MNLRDKSRYVFPELCDAADCMLDYEFKVKDGEELHFCVGHFLIYKVHKLKSKYKTVEKLTTLPEK